MRYHLHFTPPTHAEKISAGARFMEEDPLRRRETQREVFSRRFNDLLPLFEKHRIQPIRTFVPSNGMMVEIECNPEDREAFSMSLQRKIASVVGPALPDEDGINGKAPLHLLREEELIASPPAPEFPSTGGRVARRA